MVNCGMLEVICVEDKIVVFYGQHPTYVVSQLVTWGARVLVVKLTWEKLVQSFKNEIHSFDDHLELRLKSIRPIWRTSSIA